jgi:pSer/pThr/pTyr-binding forkhead associated (FHA) protein
MVHVSAEKILVLECLGPPESDWNQQSFEVTSLGCVGGRKHHVEDGMNCKEIMLFRDITVSRRHFEITAMNDALNKGEKKFYIRDLGSAGGTFIRIMYGTRKQLHPGMIILLGKHQFTVSSIDDGNHNQILYNNGSNSNNNNNSNANTLVPHEKKGLRKSNLSSEVILSLVENAEKIIQDISRDTQTGQSNTNEISARLKSLTLELSSHLQEEEQAVVLSSSAAASSSSSSSSLVALGGGGVAGDRGLGFDSKESFADEKEYAVTREQTVADSKQAFQQRNYLNDTMGDIGSSGMMIHQHQLGVDEDYEPYALSDAKDIPLPTPIKADGRSFAFHSQPTEKEAISNSTGNASAIPAVERIMMEGYPESMMLMDYSHRRCTLTCCAPDGSPLQGIFNAVYVTYDVELIDLN